LVGNLVDAIDETELARCEDALISVVVKLKMPAADSRSPNTTSEGELTRVGTLPEADSNLWERRGKISTRTR